MYNNGDLNHRLLTTLSKIAAPMCRGSSPLTEPYQHAKDRRSDSRTKTHRGNLRPFPKSEIWAVALLCSPIGLRGHG
eukprot:4416801-Pyramimonas_sp.AAC.1